MNQLGERVKELRRGRKLSQRELAEMLDMHQTNISHIETNVRGLSFPMAIKLARVFGVTTDDLIPEDYAMENETVAELSQ